LIKNPKYAEKSFLPFFQHALCGFSTFIVETMQRFLPNLNLPFWKHLARFHNVSAVEVDWSAGLHAQHFG